MPAPSSVHVDHLSPRDGEQPSFWVRRTPFPWPIGERRSEGLGEGVFGSRHIPCPCCEKGDELAVVATRDRVCGIACMVARLRVAFWEAHAFTLRRGSRRHGPDWTHLDDTVTCARATRRPGNRRVQIGHVNKIVAADLLFRLHIWAIQHLWLAIGDANCRRSRTRLQAVAALSGAGLPSWLRVRGV